MDLRRPQGRKGGYIDTEEQGTFWRGTVIDMDSRLRVGRTLGKTEAEVALALMAQLKERGHPDTPPALATDGKGSYRQAMVETWGRVPENKPGRGRPRTQKQPQPDWQYLQVVKHRSSYRLLDVAVKVVYGDPMQVRETLGEHTNYIERTHLTSRQMNGRLVRRTLSFSKELVMLEAACAWEDWVYNLTRPVKTLRQEIDTENRRWKPRSPAMAAGLADHIWTVKELLTTVVAPDTTNTV